MSVLIVGGDAQARATGLTCLSDAGVGARANVRDKPSIDEIRAELTTKPVTLIVLLSPIDFAEARVDVPREKPVQSESEAEAEAEDRDAPQTRTDDDARNSWSAAEVEALAGVNPVVWVSSKTLTSMHWRILLRAGVRDVQPRLMGEQISQLLVQLRGQNHLWMQSQQSRDTQHPQHPQHPQHLQHLQHLRELQELEQDQRAGHQVQLGMLPPSPMAIDRYRLRHQIWPSLMLSGDFVDYFEITPEHFAFYVADVAGHGASSAFVTVLLKNFSRRLRREFVPSMLTQPGEVLQWLNGELLDNELGKHVAILFGIVDTTTDELRIANAGHFPPAMLVRDGRAEFVEQAGKPAGLFAQVDYSSKTLDLLVGDRLLVVSDGVFERLDGDDLTSHEQQILAAAAQGSVDADSFWTQLGCDPSQPTADDITWFGLTREA